MYLISLYIHRNKNHHQILGNRLPLSSSWHLFFELDNLDYGCVSDFLADHNPVV